MVERGVVFAARVMVCRLLGCQLPSVFLLLEAWNQIWVSEEEWLSCLDETGRYWPLLELEHLAFRGGRRWYLKVWLITLLLLLFFLMGSISHSSIEGW